jgi:hypothetical protein
VIVHRWAGGLHQENITTSNGFLQHDIKKTATTATRAVGVGPKHMFLLMASMSCVKTHVLRAPQCWSEKQGEQPCGNLGTIGRDQNC